MNFLVLQINQKNASPRKHFHIRYFAKQAIIGTVTAGKRWRVDHEVVWVLEGTENSRDFLTNTLIGDFAVRRVSSLISLIELSRIGRHSLPAAIVISCDDFGDELITYGSNLLEDCQTLYILYGDTSRRFARAMTFFGLDVTSIEKQEHSCTISTYIQRCIRERSTSDLTCNGRIYSLNNLTLYVDRMEYRVAPSCERHVLTNKELKLLRALMERPDECLSRSELSHRGWGDVSVSSRTLDSHISRLRKRLKDAEIEITSVYGYGYTLVGSRRSMGVG